MLWPLSVVLVANTNGRLAIPALAGLLVFHRRTIFKMLALEQSAKSDLALGGRPTAPIHS